MTPRERAGRSLANSFERYPQNKGKDRGGDGGNYQRNAARELEGFPSGPPATAATAIGAFGSIDNVAGDPNRNPSEPIYRLSVENLTTNARNSIFSSEHLSEEAVRQRRCVVDFLDLTVEEQDIIRRLIAEDGDYIYFSESPPAGIRENRILRLNGDEYWKNLVAYR